MNNSSRAEKVMMICIDGFDPVYAKPLLGAGKLPNIKKLLSIGSTTNDMSMIGAMPNYTPPNWCSIATGTWPGTHGITCFWTHTLGEPLDKLSLGFDSKKCKAEYIHDAFARQGKKSIVAGWPTTWPPTNEQTILIDGTSIHPFLVETVDYERFYECAEGQTEIVFMSHKANDSGAECFVTEDIQDLQFGVDSEQKQQSGSLEIDESMLAGTCDVVRSPIKAAEGWGKDVGNAKEVVLLVNNGLERRYGLIVAEDGKTYSKIEVYRRKSDQKPLGSVKLGEWSGCIYDEFIVNEGKVKVGYHLRLIALSEDGSSLYMYGSFASDLDSDDHVYPAEIKKELFAKLGGPLMMSNCGRKDPVKMQIIYETVVIGFRWVMDALDYLMENKEWSLTLQGLHIIDQGNHVHLDHTVETCEDYQLHRDYLEKYYIFADEYVGRAFKWIDQGVAVIVTSDHGGLIVGDNSVELGDAWKLNIGVMEELGYTKVKEIGGKKVIDWSQTKAIAQRSSYIYVNLKGRDPEGIVEPEEYDQLVEQIINDLYNYRDPKSGRRVIGIALNKADMELVHLYGEHGEHVGDIFYTMEPDFAHDQGNSLPNATRSGSSIKCLFMAAGPGIKKNTVINRKVEIVDLVPTLCHLAGVDMPKTVEGGPIYQILE